jgi:predicted metal-dependent HD superfamily phosphohydrolase
MELSLTNWHSMWEELGVSNSNDDLFHRLIRCYSESHRRYHTARHLEECFAHLEIVRSLAERVGEVELALWFHDAIYDTHNSDNEERSAAWASESALAAGLSSEQASRINDLVMATRHSAAPVGTDAKLLVDIDLGILGAETDRFEEYELQVREEYGWVPELLYRSGRRKILIEFADRESIYSTEYFRAAYEVRARENIARSLSRLE